MAKAEKQKLKLLYLLDYLMQFSDETHPLSTQELISHLESVGIRAERKSIYSDISCLQEYGVDIELQKGRGGGYYIASRDFELPEVKLLVDAVQSSRFLTTKKSLELIGKLEKLTSRHDAGSLQRNVVVSGRVKNMDECIYYNVDAIHDAIAAGSQIIFRYFEWGVDRQRHFREREYTASPYALIWDNENYYLVAHSDRHGLTHYRVDKMVNIRQTGEKRYVDEETRKLDLSAYGKNVFSMFGGKPVNVKMRFCNELAGVVLDRFGGDSMLIPDGEHHFTFTAPVTISPAFWGWIGQFGNRAKVLYPEAVVEQFKTLLQEPLDQYE